MHDHPLPYCIPSQTLPGQNRVAGDAMLLMLMPASHKSLPLPGHGMRKRTSFRAKNDKGKQNRRWGLLSYITKSIVALLRYSCFKTLNSNWYFPDHSVRKQAEGGGRQYRIRER